MTENGFHPPQDTIAAALEPNFTLTADQLALRIEHFDNLVLEQRVRFVSFAFRFARTHDAAEDLVQEVLTNVLATIRQPNFILTNQARKPVNLSDRAEVFAALTRYTLQAIKFKAIDQSRRAQSTTRVLAKMGAQQAEASDDIGDFQNALAVADRFASVMVGIESASPIIRSGVQCLALKSEGYSYDEISGITGLPLSTIRMRIYRTRRWFAENRGSITLTLAD